MTKKELEDYLCGAANILRKMIDAADFKQYIFPLSFFKRSSDVWYEEYQIALEESGNDLDYAEFRENHRFQIPKGCHWEDVRKKTADVDAYLQKALNCIEKANFEMLHDVFGDAQWTNGCVEFMKECFAKLPKQVCQIEVRGDSAFFDGDLFDFLEDKRSTYIVKVKTKGLVQLLERQSWRKAKNKSGYETTEFSCACTGWKKSRRFVAVGEVTEVETDNNSLFPDMPPNVAYDYFCYCTNKDLTPWAAHKHYGKRAASENWIEWCKNQMASGSSTQDFWANSAIFQS